MGSIRLGPECSHLTEPVPDSAIESTAVLMFWFGHIPGRSLDRRAKWQIVKRLPFWAGNWGRRFWDVDRAMRERFSDDLVRAGRSEYDDWAATPVGRLALILLLDQFSRNIHRASPRRSPTMPKPSIALDGLNRGKTRPSPIGAVVLLSAAGASGRSRPLRKRGRSLTGQRYAKGGSSADHLVRRVLSRPFGIAISSAASAAFPTTTQSGRKSTRAEQRFLKQPFSHF